MLFRFSLSFSLSFSVIPGLVPWLAQAQPISFGVTGGVPISPHLQSYGQECIGSPPHICGPNDLLFRPYTIGPTIEAHLPLRLSVEASALYQRFHKDTTSGFHIHPFVDLGHRAAVSA